MRIRWLYFYCFFFVLCHSVSSVIHSLEYLVTAASGVPNIPEFTGAMMLDGIQMGYCESNNKILEPRQDWVKKMLANETWLLEMCTRQCFVVQPERFGKHISSLKEQFQSEGVHILQKREGCEWNEKTGKVTGFLQYGYNGEGFLDFDLKTLTWIALKREAAITKQEWDADSVRTNFNKNILTNSYPEWIKKFLPYGKSMMQRTVPPSVSLLQKSSSSPVSCHATGFYPDRAVMFWRKDGEKISEGVDPGEILPNHDGTFQISVDLNVSLVKSEDWRRYDCVFQFSDVENNTSTKLDKAVIRTNRGKNKLSNDQEKPSDMTVPIIPAVVVFVLIIIVAAAGFAVYKKKKVSERRPTSSPDNNDEQRNRDRLIE